MSEIIEIIEIIDNVANFSECDDDYKCEVCINLNIMPTMLIPCGHTICEKCSNKIDKCPFCRYTPTDKVINYSLKKIIEKHNGKYIENIEKFKSFFTPIFDNSSNVKELLNEERLGTDLCERILILEKLFELKVNDKIITISEEDKFGIYSCEEYYYVSYNNILMVDFDGNYAIDEIVEELSKTNESFDIYKTRNGYHAFMTSKRVNFHDKDTLKFMCDINMCDTNYILFTWLSKKANVRINRKFDEGYKSGQLYEFISSIGDSSLVDIVKDVHLHNIFTMCFANVQNTKKGSLSTFEFLFEELISFNDDANFSYCYEIDDEIDDNGSTS